MTRAKQFSIHAIYPQDIVPLVSPLLRILKDQYLTGQQGYLDNCFRIESIIMSIP